MGWSLARIFPVNFAWQRKAAPDVGPKRNTEAVGSTSNAIKPEPERKGFGDIVSEMNCDYQIAFSNHILMANLQAVQTSISVTNGDGPKSDSIQKSLQKLWDHSISAMVKSVGFGRVAFEKDWDYDEKACISQICTLDAMEYRDTRLRLTKDKHFDGFDLKVGDSGKEEDDWAQVKPENAWWLALDATKKQPHGTSQYAGAVHSAWKIKKINFDNLQQFARRCAVRGGVIHGPMTEMDERTGQPISAVERTIEAIDKLYTGGTLYLPNDRHETMEGKYKYDFSEADPTVLDPSPLTAVIDKNDVAILRALGIPEKVAIEGDGGGSYAMLTQQMLTLFARIDGLMAQFVRSFQKYVVEAVREANYEGDGPTFEMHFTKLSQRPDSFVTTLLTALVAQPQFAQIILSGGVDLRNLLEQVGLPVTAELEEVAKSVAQRMMATQGAAAGPPGQRPADDSGTDGGTPAGEFGNTSRLQWVRNVKAIREVLQDVIDGKNSPAFAQHMLESLGMNSDRATGLIEDAKGGATADAMTGPIAMGAWEALDRKIQEGNASKKAVELLARNGKLSTDIAASLGRQIKLAEETNGHNNRLKGQLDGLKEKLDGLQNGQATAVLDSQKDEFKKFLEELDGKSE